MQKESQADEPKTLACGSIDKRIEPKISRDNRMIPPIILEENPLLKEKQYLILKKDLSFLKKVVILCENCVFESVKSQEKFISDRENFSEFLGCGILRPHSLTERRIVIILTLIYLSKHVSFIYISAYVSDH